MSVEIPDRAYAAAAGSAGAALLALKAESAKATHRPPRLDAALAIRLARAAAAAAVPVVLEDRVEAVALALQAEGDPASAHCKTADPEFRMRARELLGLPCTPDGEGDDPVVPKIALRPHRRDDRVLAGHMDDVVVEDVTMFRAEQMSDGNLWLACYFADGERITFHVNAGARKVLTYDVGEIPEKWIDWDSGEVRECPEGIYRAPADGEGG